MDDAQFLTYCTTHAETPRCGFVPQQLARLLRMAGNEEKARSWDREEPQVVNCDRDEILTLVSRAESLRRLSMPWTAESALNELWAGLDLNTTRGVIRAYMRQHLQAAYDAGMRAERQADARTVEAGTTRS